MEVLRRFPLAIAQRLVHCAIAVSSAVLNRVTKTMSVLSSLQSARHGLGRAEQSSVTLLKAAASEWLIADTPFELYTLRLETPPVHWNLSVKAALEM